MKKIIQQLNASPINREGQKAVKGGIIIVCRWYCNLDDKEFKVYGTCAAYCAGSFCYRDCFEL
jgi:hypothetical protein